MQPGDTLKYRNRVWTVLPNELYKRLTDSGIALTRGDFLVGLLWVHSYEPSAQWVMQNDTDDHYVMTAGEKTWNPLP